MARELDLEQLQDLVGRIDALLKGQRADMIWQAMAVMSAHVIHHFRTSTSEKEALATYMTAVKGYLAEYRLQGIEQRKPDKPPVLQ